MSLFLDVWTNKGFVLASDVRLTSNGKQSYIHKLRGSHPSAKVICAIAVCGDYPETSLHFFDKAVAIKDTLREIAYSFAVSWTERFAGTEDHSAVHVVGFERIPGTDKFTSQMWYWHNWAPGEGFYPEDRLRHELDSFVEPVPFNNHIPSKLQPRMDKTAIHSLEEERLLVLDYLSKHQPVFTWNGDNEFWYSVGEAVKSAMGLLRDQTSHLELHEIARLAKACLQFLAEVGSLLLSSTVGLSVEKECDVITVTPHGIECIEWAKWSGRN